MKVWNRAWIELGTLDLQSDSHLLPDTLPTALRSPVEDFMAILGKESPSYSTVKKWAAEFKSGRESIEDDVWSGHPKDTTIDENVKVVHTLKESPS